MLNDFWYTSLQFGTSKSMNMYFKVKIFLHTTQISKYEFNDFAIAS